MNKNQVEGRAHQAKGKVKEIVGKLTGNKETEYKGKAEKQGGKAESKYGDVKEDVKKATD
ncbi:MULTISPECIES: CsbD family protein [Halomonas]|uniref:CsbD family protein n=1 Tax=Halomonas tibetensis TaxID=2259590 RepID=A0ABV7B235_9GAMM